jgi:hypothetical protein
MYAKPWTVTQEFQLEPDGELIEYVCGENNRDIPHLVGKYARSRRRMSRCSAGAVRKTSAWWQARHA